MESIVNKLKNELIEVINNYKRKELAIVFDRVLRNDDVVSALLNNVEFDIKSGRIPSNIIVICSGKFGELVKDKFINYPNILVSGGLREVILENLTLPNNISVKDKNCIFVDDSIHSGRTLNRIVIEIKKKDGKVIAGYFAYRSGDSLYVPYINSIIDKKDLENVNKLKRF